ncbi:AcrR family transcriptional regulator [Arthrobacter stackebrandtii]|uniref:AcrR family transcriptional regulator n=1 Tax=Arthrobacter stackebrandtii TaxID=272161 RepID=A0ABS4YZS0_9MICC|nr:TetR/AcrR family transcriptional regulator [Arthrobacter stackebrandtii]MBP2414292.1 AcrR family transcriptional regulator [Arthrobacter stackebrandtii]PYH01449.1 TetR family transcriptional regulator [Arthrobacter stackebrandtii]
MFSERVRPREAQRQATRQDVLDAAEALFHTEGFKATTVRRIAAGAGVSIGTVMAAGDKDSLLVEAMDRRIRLMHQARMIPETGFLAMKAGGNAPEMVAALVQPFMQLFAEDLDLAREYGAVLMRGRHQSEVFGSLALQLKSEFEQAYKLFGLGRQAARTAATATHLAYLGILLSWSAGAFGQEDALVQLKESVAALMGEGDGRS